MMPNWEAGQQQGDGGGQPSLTRASWPTQVTSRSGGEGPVQAQTAGRPGQTKAAGLGRELCGARTEQRLLEADSEGPASYAPSPRLPENHLEGSLQ